jgi:putative membrane protein
MLIVVAMIVAGAVLIARSLAQRTSHAGSSGPLQILEERYARGEIDEDEFRKRREVLRG